MALIDLLKRLGGVSIDEDTIAASRGLSRDGQMRTDMGGVTVDLMDPPVSVSSERQGNRKGQTIKVDSR